MYDAESQWGTFADMSSPRRINPIAAEVQFIPLQAGFYLATLRGTIRAPQSIGHFVVPSAQIAGLHPPTGNGERIEILGARGSAEGWLQQKGDQVVFRVPRGGGQILITTYRAQNLKESDLDIAILPLTALLDQSAGRPQTPMPGPQLSATAASRPPAATPAAAAQSIPDILAILVHNAMLGDRQATTDVWAGDAQRRQHQLEGFAVTAADSRFPADGLTYRAGFTNRRETPWLPLGRYCGTRGQGLGMVGIALKLSPALSQRGLEIEYSVVGRRSGEAATARNGATCYLPDGDVICGIKVRLVRRAGRGAGPGAAPRPAPQPAAAPRSADLGAWL
jgi:hypothetical protein